MITKIIDSNKKHLGYLVDNVWIPNNTLWVYTPYTTLPYESIKQGYKRRYNIEVDNSIYLNILYNFVNKPYINEVFSSNNIEMNDIVLLSYKDFNYNLLSSLWKVPNSKSEKFAIYYEDKIIGYLQVKDSLSSDILYICMIEMIERGKGYGSKSIQFLLKHKSIEGYSVVSALGFWLSMGADFYEEGNCRFKIQGGLK